MRAPAPLARPARSPRSPRRRVWLDLGWSCGRAPRKLASVVSSTIAPLSFRLPTISPSGATTIPSGRSVPISSPLGLSSSSPSSESLPTQARFAEIASSESPANHRRRLGRPVTTVPAPPTGTVVLAMSVVVLCSNHPLAGACQSSLKPWPSISASITP